MSKAPVLLGSSGDSLREACGKELTKIAPDYPNVVVLDADIAGGTGMHHFRKTFPDRFIQCGIAEQNMMAMAGGLAATGLIPVVTTFAVFMLRSIEQARLSIGYADMNVKIVASHPGLDVGPDGASAQCLEDLACYRSIPNMVVLSPCDPLEIEQATKAILDYEGPVYMRTGRSDAQRILGEDYQFEIGKAKILKNGSDITIMGCGVTTGRALEAAKILEMDGISVRIVNMSTIKPIDSAMVIKCANETKGIITVEDHNILGGLGSAVAEVLVQHNPVPMEFVGVRDSFGESGEPNELAKKYGIDYKAIIKSVHQLLERI
ncbi:MAG: transketolase family protein [Candidatus Marinimicrobia bacterium]|nr:transketolase family protein [Candidatus Neomarinimicrobiota bacterium]MBT6937165.1 transketolase family protein [Candidatus Neomarinimicrobiota bacterium]